MVDNFWTGLGAGMVLTFLGGWFLVVKPLVNRILSMKQEGFVERPQAYRKQAPKKYADVIERQ